MIKIAVVEDKADVRKSLVRMIDRTEGMLCISEYENAEDALNNIPDIQPDLVLMDIGLPRMNGIECLIRIQLKNANIDFLMFTIFDDDENVFEAIKAGAAGYILKSDGPMGAIKAIKEFMDGGAPMSRTVARKVLNSFGQRQKNKNQQFTILTNQQKTVLEQLSLGLLNKEIADRLNIKENTVKQHVHAIYKKLQVNNRAEAIRKYLESN